MPIETPEASSLKYIVVGGSDKVGISAFCRHCSRILGPEWGLGESHWLMSPEELAGFPALFTDRFPRGIVSYYYKFSVANRDPEKIMPPALRDMGDLVVWFELYRSESVVLKVPENDSLVQEIMAQWSKILSGGA